MIRYMNEGKEGEIKAKQCLESKGWKVKDLTTCQDFFKKDIDFLISKNDIQVYIECKWDSRISSTGNLFIETSTDIEEDKEGWFQYCQADFIFYGDANNNLFYVFVLDDLKRYIQEQDKPLPERRATEYDRFQRKWKVSKGLLVSIEDFRRHYPVQVFRLD